MTTILQSVRASLTAATAHFPKGSSKGGQFMPGKGRAELTAARKVDAKIGERTRATPYGVGRKTTTKTGVQKSGASVDDVKSLLTKRLFQPSNDAKLSAAIKNPKTSHEALAHIIGDTAAGDKFRPEIIARRDLPGSLLDRIVGNADGRTQPRLTASEVQRIRAHPNFVQMKGMYRTRLDTFGSVA